MSKSAHQIAVKAADQTAGGFASIKNRAAATGAQIRSIVGGAIAAAGAYLGFRAVKGGIDELGHLSDIARKTGTNVAELTSAAQALSILGIQNMGVDQIGKAFDYLQKTTGRSGMEGFYQTIDEIAKIPDVAKRGQEAMRIFGRSGMEFMPLINAANSGTDAIRGVISAMPAVPQAAADAGDAVSDAMSIAATGVKSIWLQGIGAVCDWINQFFPGGVREAAAQAAAWLEYYAKVGASNALYYFHKVQNFFEEGTAYWATLIGAMASGSSISEAMKFAGEQYEFERDANRDIEASEKESLDRRVENWRKAYEERKKIIEALQANYDKAAVKSGSKFSASIADAAKSIKAVRNDLIMGGSNAATRLQILGPSLQTESKKQTALLEKIANNTEKTADNTEADKSGDSLEVID